MKVELLKLSVNEIIYMIKSSFVPKIVIKIYYSISFCCNKTVFIIKKCLSSDFFESKQLYILPYMI